MRFATRYSSDPTPSKERARTVRIWWYFTSDLAIAQQLSVADLERSDQSLANSTANVGSC
jgi:hypothetical protein